jgi:hypothetical protein
LKFFRLFIFLWLVVGAVLYLMSITVHPPAIPSQAKPPEEPDVSIKDAVTTTDAAVLDDFQPSSGYLAGRYLKYLNVLNDGSPPEAVFAMCASKWLEGMLQQNPDKRDLLGFLRMTALENEFEVVDATVVTRNDSPSGQNGRYGILHLQGNLAASGEEVSDTVYFYEENGEWKLSGEINSITEKIMHAEEGKQSEHPVRE